MEFPLLSAGCLLGLWIQTMWVNRVQPDSYMDECFHWNQTLAYCRGHFSYWDNKITTLPGLYALPVVWKRGVDWWWTRTIEPSLDEASACHLYVGRRINLIYWLGGLIAAFFWFRRAALHSSSSSSTGVPFSLGDSTMRREAAHRRIQVWSALSALRVQCMPITLFFVSLYYTDTLSTFSVWLLLIGASEYGWNVTSVPTICSWSSMFKLIACIVAIMARQTNVIWVIFSLFLCVHQQLARLELQDAMQLKKTDSNSRKHSISWMHGTDVPPQRLSVLLVSDFVTRCFSFWPRLIVSNWPHLLSICGFSVFIIVNRGIVLGDRSNHNLSFHWTQLLYMSALVTILSSGCLLTRPQLGKLYLRRILFEPMFHALLFALIAWLVHNFTMSHPFLLADNRHITFYVWRYMLSPITAPVSYSKYLFIPLYTFSLWLMNERMSRRIDPLVRLFYWMCTALVLVPTPLIEPRYFIAPVAIFHALLGAEDLEYHFNDGKYYFAALIDISANLIIHFAMLGLFSLHSYTWVDGTNARFMW